jgi:hypothetical protein
MALKDLLVYVDQTVRLRLGRRSGCSARQQTNSTLRAGMESRQLDWRLVSADRARAVARWRRVGQKPYARRSASSGADRIGYGRPPLGGVKVC